MGITHATTAVGTDAGTGEIHKAEWNAEHLITGLGVAFIGARAYRTTSQTVTAGVETAMTFDAEEFDTDTFHDNSTNPSRMTIPAGLGGKYLVQSHLGFPGASHGVIFGRIKKNGTTFITGSEDDLSTGSDSSLHPGVVIDLAAGDYVEIFASRASGTAIGATTNSFSNTFEIVKLDSGKIGQGIGARAYKAAVQAIATGDAYVEATFDTEEFDTDGFHDNSTNPSRFTIPAGLGGKYLLTAGGAWDTNSSGTQRVDVFQKNGSTVVGTEIGKVPSAATQLGTENAVMLDLAAGDYVEHAVYQDSGGNRNYGGTTGSKSAWMSIMRLDSGSATLGLWQDWTPTWTSSTPPSLGNGTLVGRYKLLDAKTLLVRLNFVRGSTSTNGSGTYSFTGLPFTLAARDQWLTGGMVDAGSAYFVISGRCGSSGTAISDVVIADGTGSRVWTGTMPVTLATNDEIVLSGILELA